MPITLDGTNGITTPTYGGADTSEYLVPVTAFKNRIINGAMVIDQRNAGASVSASGSFPVDRWNSYFTQASKLTMQQNAGSVTPPAGFTNYLGITSSSAYSITSSDAFVIYQKIEGYNVADLAFGTANAKTVTLSFWVRSSLTGTFGGALVNSAENRSYPYTYTISSANTWEQKSITIAGDTTGTWLTTNGTGMTVFFSMGTGANLSGTAGAWVGAQDFSATGATSVVGTNGATFYITGVQLEVGSTATSFDYRPYGTEFDLCRRYYEQYNYTNAGGANQYIGSGGVGMAWTGTDVRIPIGYYPKRASATCAFSGTIRFATNAFGQNFTSVTFDNAGVNTVLLFNGSASGFTAGQAQQVTAQAANTFISISAEL